MPLFWLADVLQLLLMPIRWGLYLYIGLLWPRTHLGRHLPVTVTQLVLQVHWPWLFLLRLCSCQDLCCSVRPFMSAQLPLGAALGSVVLTPRGLYKDPPPTHFITPTSSVIFVPHPFNCGSTISCSAPWAWQQAPLPTEPACQCDLSKYTHIYTLD